MLHKRKIKSLDFLEVFLVLIFIMLVSGIFYFISNFFKIDIFLYNSIILLLIVLTILVATVAIFQFVKMKYVKAVKAEMQVEMDNYKTKIGNKLIESNNRIGYFEVEYSKKLKKITKDYLIKAKEIEEIKKELAGKIMEINRKTAELEVETCLIKIEKMDLDHKIISYERILKLNIAYPGVKIVISNVIYFVRNEVQYSKFIRDRADIKIIGL